MSKQEDHQSHFENSWSPHDSIITCLRDGSAINWMPPTSDGKVERWQKAYQLRIPSPPMSPHGPPQGNGPPHQVPLGVNMIVWSLDTCFILAAIVDHRICMWNAVDGSLMHSLTGHEKQTYILYVHPFTPRIAMGAGYDGHVIIWVVSCFTENPQNLFDLFGEQD